MSHIHVPNEIPVKYLERGGSWNMVFAGMFVIGLATLGYTLMNDPDRAWQAYVANWLFFTGVALGAMIFTAATVIVKAKWNWPVRRLGLAFVAFLPISFLLLLPMMSLGADYFPWLDMMATDPLVQKKAAYLNLPFLRTRNIVGALVLFGMACYFAYLALRPDMGLTEDEVRGDDGRTGWRARLMSNWAGQEAEVERSWRKMSRLAPAMILVYAVVMSVFIYDWVMSLEPHWFSTMMGPWFFMGSFWVGIAAITHLAMILKGKDRAYDDAIQTSTVWDLGKLCFAFTVFWGYLFFSQYIVIWYGKLPWEQAWIIHRSEPPWGALSLLMVTLCFFIPFPALLGAKPKRTPGWLRGITIVIFAGVWLERFLMVAPSIRDHETPTFGIQEPLIALMFLGLFLYATRWFLTTFPVMQVWHHPDQPEMFEAEVYHDAEVA
jgi:Ni/Fe-hydrogenase subunit HybB-like protein